MIPRIGNENYVRGLLREPATRRQPSFWCAVLRGRLPALVVQPQSIVDRYANDSGGIFGDSSLDQERALVLAAVVTGDISRLPNQQRNV
jgi:hypothetical protein